MHLIRRLLLGCLLALSGDAAPPVKFEIVVRDDKGPLSGVNVTLREDQKIIKQAETDETGHLSFNSVPAGRYVLTAAKPGYETHEEPNLDLSDEGLAIEVMMVRTLVHSDSVEVRGSVMEVDADASVPNRLPPIGAEQLPSRPATVADALPLIPGVVREPGGALILSSSPESRSALIVNSADVTDPATGQFGLTVPIDTVEVLSVYQAAYLAEYGRFTAGLVSVETKRGGDKWKWALNDPLPEFRIRSWQLRGLRTATPRVNVEGPLIAGKLFLNQGIEYDVEKTAVYTLPFPFNQKKREGFNSFTQLDWVASSHHLVTATMHIAPQRLGALNMDYFNPLPTAPDASTHNYTGTIIDQLTFHGGVLENRFSVTKFDSAVWGLGTQDLVIAPGGNTGNYFADQGRDASRISGASRYAFAPVERLGTHRFKVGGYLARSDHSGNIRERPIDLVDALGRPVMTVSFSRVGNFEVDDLEKSFFAQDHWIMSQRLAVDLGVRTEAQQISGAIRVAPRAGLAWTPVLRTGTVIRGGYGLFYDRVPLNVYAFNRYPNRHVTFYSPDGGILTGPDVFLNTLGQNRVRFPFVSQEPVDGNFSPRSAVGSVQIEQRLSRLLKVRATYLSNVSNGLVTLVRVPPDPATNIGAYLLQGSGASNYHQFDVLAQLRVREDREVFFSFVRSRARGDLNDFGHFLGTVPAAVIHENQYGTLSTDLPNRFLSWGVVRLTKTVQIAPVIEFRSGFPYSVNDVLQRYVAVPNSSRFPNFISVDSRISKDIRITPKYTMRFSVAAFNLTNHLNPEAVHNNIADPAIGYFFGHRGRRFTADFDFLF